MTAERLRLASFALLVVTAGGLFLAWSQPWFTLALQRQSIVVRGDVAAGALPSLALVSLALILALALAGPVFRIVLGALEVLVGAGAIVASAFAIAHPAVVAVSAITKATGIAGASATDLVESAAVTGWPAVAIVAGGIGVLTGLLIAITARHWPMSGRRFTRSRAASPEGGPRGGDADDPVREWDALTDGDDPTRPAP